MMNWSGFSRSPPRRTWVRGSELSPFCTSPSQLHEVTLDPLSSSGDGNSGLTMKDYEAQLSHYKKENFNLKLRIYFLEERFGPYKGGNEKEDPYKKNIELKVQTETLRKELLENQQLLRDADKAMDQMEKEHKEELQKLIEKQKMDVEKLESQMEGMKKDYEARLEKPNHEDSAAMYAFAFDMPELYKQNNLLDKALEEKLQQKIKELENQVNELESHLSNKEDDCSRLEFELSNVRSEREELNQEVERCSNRMLEMKGKIDEKDQELDSARKQINNLEEALMAKEPEIRIKVQELSERDKVIEEKNSKLEEKEKVLVEIQITLDEKQRQIEALRASLASKDEALTGLRSKLAESESATRDLQDKFKSQWANGLNFTPKQLVQLEKNVTKKRVTSYRNHVRGQKEVPNGEAPTLPKRPVTAPPNGRAIDTEEDILRRLREEVEAWKKKAGEMQKEVEQKDNLAKNWGNEEAKMKFSLQGMKKHSKELEKEVDKYKQDLRRKDKKIRDLICELTVAQDQVNRAKWEGVGGAGVGRHQGISVGFASGLDDVNDMADEENERLWAELDDKEKKLKQVTEEKNAISVEMEKKIQSLLSTMQEKEATLAGFEEKYNSAAAQLLEKSERIQTLEAQLTTAGSLSNLEQKATSIAEWTSRESNQFQNSRSMKEMFAVRLSSATEERSFLHTYIQKLHRNLRNTPEREGGPRGALEEVEEARREAEEVRALLGGHLWELATFLEGLLEETNLSLSEPHKSTIRRALEWSRELSLSVLSTTGLGDDSEQNCTRTSLAILRDFPSFYACVEAAESNLSGKIEEGVAIEGLDGHVSQTVVISEVESPKPEDESSEVKRAGLSVESLQSTVEALHTRVRELERGKMIDLREGSSEMGRGGNSGESVRTVRDVRPSHLSLAPANETLKVVEQKLEGRSDAAPMSCTPAGVVVSPSESEGWSEPDRSVSMARMGLEDIARATPSVAIASAAQQSTPESGGSSLVETRTPSKRSHGEVRRLQNRLRGLEQLIESLRAEVRVYHTITPAAKTGIVGDQSETPQNNVVLEMASVDQKEHCMRDAEVNTTVGVQSEAVDGSGVGHLLEEVRCLRDKLEYSLKHNELIGRQLEGVLSGLQCHQMEDGMANLCHKLKDATERLEEEQARCRDLHNQLTSAKNSLCDKERELKEAKAVEIKLKALLKEKEEQIKDILESKEIKIQNTTKDYGVIAEDSCEKVYTVDNDQGESSLEKTQDQLKLNGSLKERETMNSGVIFKDSSFDFGDQVFFRNSAAVSDSSCYKRRLHDWPSLDKGVPSEDKNSKEVLGHKLGENVRDAGILGKHSGNDDSLPRVRRSIFDQDNKEGRLLELENKALYLQTALKEAQDHAHVEESRARKAEEEAQHWMKVAKEYEKIGKMQETVRIKTVEDPSECSSSSALSGILPDLTRQRSEMSDYVSDQTGGEDSEPSMIQMSHKSKNLSGRPGIIPLEMSHAMTYLSPSADTSPTARHDAFSSPDLGIESDPGRFSSLENQPPKSPEGISLHNGSFDEVHSSENTIVYSSSFTAVDRSHRTRTPGSHIVKEIDDVISISYVKDLMLENDRLKQCLAKTQKHLDETLLKLEASNRRKRSVEKAICNQLQKTHYILQRARVNLEAEK